MQASRFLLSNSELCCCVALLYSLASYEHLFLQISLDLCAGSPSIQFAPLFQKCTRNEWARADTSLPDYNFLLWVCVEWLDHFLTTSTVLTLFWRIAIAQQQLRKNALTQDHFFHRWLCCHPLTGFDSYLISKGHSLFDDCSSLHYLFFSSQSIQKSD